VCFFEKKSRKGLEMRCWRLVVEVIGPLTSWSFEDIAEDLYRSSQRYTSAS